VIRHIVFHLFPGPNTSLLELNIQALQRYAPLFNGRRLMQIASPDYTPPMPLDGWEVTRVVNDPELGETPHFLPALSRLANTSPDEITFYAHTKGVSLGSVARVGADIVRFWTDVMWRRNLQDISQIERVLMRYPCCGIFKETLPPEVSTWHGPYRPKDHGWQYAGTFFWFRHDRLFSQAQWDYPLARTRFGTERYLDRFFGLNEAWCLWGTHRAPCPWARLQDLDAVQQPNREP
jgi:hypothetical protein